MSTGHYLTAATLLTVLVACMAVTAATARRVLMPGLSGAPARTAEVVAGLAVVILLSEALGSVGEFKRLPLVVGSVVVAAIAILGFLRFAPRAVFQAEGGHAVRSGIAASVVALVGVSFAVSRSLQAALEELHGGMRSFDTLWYHMPFAAQFVQDASLTRLHFTGNGPTTFYPSNGELIHAIGIVLFGNDVLSPVINLGWLGLALMGGWCVGRPSGVAPATMTATALAAFLPVMGGAQAGTASNDIVALALLVGAVALLRNGGGSHVSLGWAAVAAGLAVGTKLNLWSSVLALGIVLIAATAKGGRLAASRRWTAGVVLGSGFWYARNLTTVGNPFPWFGAGLGLPSTSAPVDCGRASVAHYLPHPGFVNAHLLPQLQGTMGASGLLVLGLAATGIVAGILPRRPTMERGLAVVALVSGVAYLFTPATAGGHNADCFAFNTRFAVPAVALGLILLPLVVARSRLGSLIATPLFALTLLVTVGPWRGFEPLLGALILAAGLCFIGLGWSRAVPRPALVGVLITIGLVVGLAGWQEQRVYLRSRYTTPRFGEPIEAISFRLRQVRNARIAVVGFAENYPFYGTDLSNRVEYPVRRKGAKFVPYSSCRPWLLALSAGHYSYVITARQGNLDAPAAAWTRRYPGADLVSAASETGRNEPAWRWQLYRLKPTVQVDAKAACTRRLSLPGR